MVTEAVGSVEACSAAETMKLGCYNSFASIAKDDAACKQVTDAFYADCLTTPAGKENPGTCKGIVDKDMKQRCGTA